MAPPISSDRVADPLGGYLGYQLRRASTVCMADLANSLAPLGLRAAEASILMVVRANPDITQSDIGRLLGIKRANMAPLIAALDQRGLVERDALDGRSQALRLSPAGETLTAATATAIETHEARFLPDLDPRARRVLLEHLRAVRLTGAALDSDAA